MTRALYYSSTVRNIKDVIKYFIHPLGHTTAYIAFRGDTKKADLASSAFSTIAYNALSFDFLGQEANIFDAMARDAVCAELGVDPVDFKFSRFWDSKNTIVKTERTDFTKVQKFRTLTDWVFALPIAFSGVHKAGPSWLKNIVPERGFKLPLPDVGSKRIDALKYVLSASDPGNLGYAAKAVYWAAETFFLKKTAHYELVKIAELVESSNGDIGFNDLMRLYQRCRVDRGEPRLHRGENAYIRPLFEKVAQEFNTNPHFRLPALTYLFGLDKIKIHDESGNISETAIQQSMREIERVANLGLDGIRKEKQQELRDIAKVQGNEMDGQELSISKPKLSFREKVGRKSIDFLVNNYRKLPERMIPSTEEHISSRNRADIESSPGLP